MYRTLIRLLPPLLMGFLLVLLASSHSTVSQISAYMDEEPQPLPTTCDGVAPLDDPDACCAFGYVYYLDSPIAGATVRIESADATWESTTGDYGVSDDAHYQIDLTTDLQVAPGDEITITVSYNDMVSSRTWTVQPGSQQMDVGLIEGYQASSPLSANTALDQPAPNVQASGYTAVLARAKAEREDGKVVANVANLSYPEPAPVTQPNGVASQADKATDKALGGQNVEYVGHIGGTTEAVFVQGNYAYIGEGPGLTILDITNPTSPTLVGKTAPMPDLVQDVYVSGNYAYIADRQGGLRVVDISTPTSPTEVGVYDSPGYALGVYVSGNYAYLADGHQGLRVVNIEEPTSPTEVGFYDSPGYAYDVYVSGNYAYLADGGSGLRLVDVSTPTSPTEVGFYNSPGGAEGVYVSGNYAYLADGFNGLRVVDISTPSSPTEVGFYDSPGIARGVYVSGHYAYLADGYNGGLRVVDISTPGSPTQVGFYDPPGYAYHVYVSGNKAYLVDGDNGGLRVVNIEEPTSPTEVGFYNSPGWTQGVYVSGDYAYLADTRDGLGVVDISTPTSPTEVGFYYSAGYAQGVYVSGNYAYLADAGLRVVDISEPTSPTEVGFYNSPAAAYGVYVSGNYAYLADWYAGLRVVDISTPTSPTEVGFYDSPGYAYGVYVSGNYAYLADGDDGGLRVVDISTPTSPTEVGFYDSPGRTYSVYVSGNYAYLADGGSGLRVVDISTPTSPTEVGFYDSPGSAKSVYVSGNYAYLADSGLRVVDISEPTSPTEVGFYDSPGSAEGVYVSGNYAYLADLSGGLLILQFTSSEVPDIALSAASISVTLDEGQSSSETLVISNTGTSDLDWQVSGSAAWLSVAPTSGTVVPAGSASVSVDIDASGLSAGTYTDTLTITSNDADEPSVEVLVSLVVGSRSITEVKLTASDGASEEQFGRSVSISGDVLLVGAVGDGAAYIYRWNGNQWQEESKLLASDGASSDYFGSSVSIDGNVALVGALYDDDNGSSSGSAYIYRWDGSQWQEESKLLASDGARGDYFGRSVSIDGNVALVGAPYDDDNGDKSGSAYIYRWNGSQWQEESKLIPSDGAESHWFGDSVSIDGNVALVGAAGDDDNGSYSGSVHIYRWNGNQWQEESKLLASDGASMDYFGAEVSIDGNVALVGAPYDDDNGDRSGSAYIYRWDGNQWQEESKLLASDGSEDNAFGKVVSIDGNMALIAADEYGSFNGWAYIYRWDGSQWQEESKLLASDGAARDYFGYDSVSIDGNVALIGAHGDNDNIVGENVGAAYLYNLASGTVPDIALNPTSILHTVDLDTSSTYSLTIKNAGYETLSWSLSSEGAAWLTVNATEGQLAPAEEHQVALLFDANLLSIGTYSETLTITSNDPDEPTLVVPLFLRVQPPAVKLTASDGASGDHFGGSVSIDGNVALVGASGDDDNSVLSGSAYIYRWNGSQWAEEAKLTASDGANHNQHNFGSSVSIDGNVALVGAHGDDDNGSHSGSAYIYRWDGSQWVEEAKLTASDGASEDLFGISVSLDGDIALVGAVGDDNDGDMSGAAYIYRWDGSQWQEESKLLASDGSQYDSFGRSVSLDGNVALVGTPYDDDNGEISGSAYIYRWNGSQWQEESKLLASDGVSGDHFGDSVSLDGNVALVGASCEIGCFNGGSAYIYRWDGNLWVEEAKLTASDGINYDRWRSVSLDGNLALVGVEEHSESSYSGSAYLFRWDGSQWVEVSKLTPSEESYHFGGSVSINGNTALIGDFYDDDNGTGSGSAYVYDLSSLANSPEITTAFSASPISGTAPLNVTFTDESSGGITSWTWDFGDGYISGARYPEHKYWLPGSYTVSLTVSAPGGSDTNVKVDYITVSEPVEVNTLILTNRQKVATLHGEAAATVLMNKLGELAAHERVQGLVIPVENEPSVAAAYAAWDANPTSTDNANAVTSAIKDVIDGKLASYPDLEYIVVAGDDRVIPFRRVRDQTWYSERRYRNKVSCDSVTGAALCDDMTLTDDYYADRVPFVPRSRGWDGHDLYLPDLGIGRLIETPEEMMAQINTFLGSDGISVSNAAVTGYTFVTDAAAKSCGALNGAGVMTDCSLIQQNWSKNDFIVNVLDSPHDLVSINGHANHYQIGAPNGPPVTSEDIANAPDIHQGAIFYTIACHSGLNVPPDNSYPLDTAQALAQKQANLVANTGYGYGFRYSVGLSEQLMINFTKELVNNEQATLGQALVVAKQQYYLRDHRFGYYDEKILIESTLYGLPMYEVSSPSSLRAATGEAALPAEELPEGVIVEEIPIPLDGEFSKTQISFELPALTEETTPDGTYYTLGELVHSEQGEPIQPRLPFEVSVPGTNAHGLVFKGGSYSDISPFDPVIEEAFTLTLPSAVLAEPPFTTTNWYPAIPSQLNSLNNGANAQLTALLGQYNSTIEGGSERLYTELSVDIYYHADSDDWTEATITSVNSDLATNTATVTVGTSDESGIHEVLVTYSDGNGSWQSATLTDNGDNWSGSFPATANTEFFVQVVDQAGNVAVDDNEGAYYQSEGSQLPVIMHLTPLTLTTSVSQAFEVAIEVEADTQVVNGASAYLNFDPAYLEVATIALGSELPIELEKSFDNNSGQINLSAGAFSNFPSGTFTLATVTFTAIAQADGTPIEFNLTGLRQSNAVFNGTSVLNRTIGNTVVIYNATLSCSVDLQGRLAPPNSARSVPLWVSLTVPSQSTPAYTFTPTTDENGTFTVEGLEPGSYELRVKHSHTLQNMQSVTLVAGSNSIDCGTLLEGDADNNNVINILDFSILAGTFGKCEGMTGYDSRADLNGDDCVNILDFSLLAGNFGQAGAPPWPTLRLPDAPSEATGEVAIVVEAVSEVKTGEHFTVAVQLETGSQLVDGAQVALSFDPAVLEVVDVTAGEELPGKHKSLLDKRKALPLELQKQFDNARGTIQFAAGTLEEFPSGTIKLLQIEFRALAETTGTKLRLQDDSDVTFAGTSLLDAESEALPMRYQLHMPLISRSR